MKNASDVSPAQEQAQPPGQPGAEPASACTAHPVNAAAVARARAAQPSPGEARRALDLFMLLSNEARLRTLIALRPDAEHLAPSLCVCDLAAVVGVSESMMSHQLRLLRQAGLVSFRREGKLVLYSLADPAVVHLLGDALEHVRDGMDGI